MIIRRCVPENEQGRILYECHTIFKDCFEWVKLCDQWQRMGSISRRHEMPL